MSFAGRLAHGLLQGASDYYRELAVQQEAERRRFAAAGAVAMREEALQRLRTERALPAKEQAAPGLPTVNAADALQAHEGLHLGDAGAAAGGLHEPAAIFRAPVPGGRQSPRVQLEHDDPTIVPDSALDGRPSMLSPATQLEPAEAPPNPSPAPPPRREQARGANGQAILPRSEFEAGLSSLIRPGVTEAELTGFARRNGYKLDPARVRNAVLRASDYDRSNDWLTGTIRLNEARAAAERAAPRTVPASDLIIVDPHATAYNREMTAWIAAHPRATAQQISDASRDLGRARYEDRYMIAVDAAQPYVDYRRRGGRYSATVVAGPGIAHRADRFTGHENDQWNASNMKAALDAASDGHGNIDLDRLSEETRPTLADSVIKGVTTLRRGGGAFTEAVGELVGAESLVDYGREVRERNSAILAVVPEGTRVADIRNMGDALQWAKEVVGENAIVMTPGVGGAAIGGRLLGTWGAVAGAFAPSEMLGVGEAQVQLKSKDPNARANVWTLVGGTAVAALDSILPARVGSQLVRRFGSEAAEAIAIRALTRPVSARAAAALREGGRGARIEGLTEIVQEVVLEFSAAAGAGQAPDLESLPGRAIESGARGAFIGFGAGSASGAARGPSIDPSAAFDDPDATARDTNRAAIDALSPDLGALVAPVPKVTLTPDHPSVGAMIARAAHPQSELDAFGTGYPAYRSGGTKSPARIAEKVTNEGYRSVTDLKDVARGAFVVDSVEEAERFAAAIRGRFKVVQDKGWKQQADSLYLDHKLIVRFDNGVRGEIQIVPRAVWDVKQGTGKGLYDVARSSNDERAIEAARGKERALYASALEGSEFASLSSSSRSAPRNSLENSSRESLNPRNADLPTNPGANRHSPESQTQARPLPPDQATPTPRSSNSYNSSLTGSTSSDRLRASNQGDKQRERPSSGTSPAATSATGSEVSSPVAPAQPRLTLDRRSLVLSGADEETMSAIRSVLPLRVRPAPRSDGSYTLPRKYEADVRAVFEARRAARDGYLEGGSLSGRLKRGSEFEDGAARPRLSRGTSRDRGGRAPARPVVSLSGNELGVRFRGGRDMPALRQAAVDWYGNNLLGQTVTTLDGREVRFNARGLRKSTSKGETLLRSIPAIAAILKKGRLIESRPGRDHGTRSVHLYGGMVDLDGRLVDLGVFVRETREGHFQYDFTMVTARDGAAGAKANR